MEESGGKRRMVSVAAGSVWESRMKNDKVKGGIKVFNDPEMMMSKTNKQPRLNTTTRARNNTTTSLVNNDHAPSPVLKKTRSDQPPLLKAAHSPTMIRKTKSELPNRVVISSNPSSVKDVSDPSSCGEAHSSNSDTNHTPANSSSTPTSEDMINHDKTIEFNPLGISVLCNKQILIQDGQKDASILNPVNIKVTPHPADFKTHNLSKSILVLTAEEEEEEGMQGPEKTAPTLQDDQDVVTVTVTASGDGDPVDVDVDGDIDHQEELVGDGKEDNGLLEIEVGKTIIEKEINNAPETITITGTTGVVTGRNSKPQFLNKLGSIISNTAITHKSFPTLKKPTASSPWSSISNSAKFSGKESDEFYRIPESHGRLQSIVDLIMWRDVSRSAFIFGIGTFIIISSSYAKDLNISLISAGSYVALVYLAIVFMYRSIMCRGNIDEEEEYPHMNLLGKEEALWIMEFILPYLNEFLFKMRDLFSGDPAVTMKLALMLFVLARCGSSITISKVIKLGFFGVFVIPKLCLSYSIQISAYGKFWVGRFQDAWRSCSYKKVVAFAVFSLVWNCCSIVARAWAGFMLFVALRYYHQSLSTADDCVEDGPTKLNHLHQVHTRRRNKSNKPTTKATVEVHQDQKKEKKTF